MAMGETRGKSLGKSIGSDLKRSVDCATRLPRCDCASIGCASVCECRWLGVERQRVSPAQPVRSGWRERFRKLAQNLFGGLSRFGSTTRTIAARVAPWFFVACFVLAGPSLWALLNKRDRFGNRIFPGQ